MVEAADAARTVICPYDAAAARGVSIIQRSSVEPMSAVATEAPAVKTATETAEVASTTAEMMATEVTTAMAATMSSNFRRQSFRREFRGTGRGGVAQR